MSDVIKHECGIAFIRLRKPLQYFIDKYGSPGYALTKMYLLMEKQHNRGQDGAGLACVKMDLKPGKNFINRYRSIEPSPISDIFRKATKKLKKVQADKPNKYQNASWLRDNVSFVGEVYMGHLRYGTHGKNSIDNCHPMFRRNNWRSRNLLLAGNFNMTNVDELFDKLIELGQHPNEKVDTVTVMEKIGHFLDEQIQILFDKYNESGYSNHEITEKIEQELNLQTVLERACRDFDGGYTMMGVTGYGGSFIARDPGGIRPAYYYADDEVIVAASEKPAIKTAMNCQYDDIQEITPGHALIVDKLGNYAEHEFLKPLEKTSCSFERIYFSRGSDPQIYEERKMLGKNLVPQILKAIDYDLENAVFSYIPNTAETSFLGMMDGIEDYLVDQRKKAIEDGKVKGKELEKILTFRPRMEKLVIKDAKMRTFITDDDHRDEMVMHVYDTTYEVIKKKVDTLVVIDDSIVRGSTLEKSIITMLDRLEPKRIVVVSSAPQIRFPDCYGIDMSNFGEFVAFRAMIALVKDTGQMDKLKAVYEKCKAAPQDLSADVPNYVNELFGLFTYQQVSDKVAEIIKQEHINAEIEVIYQTVEGLHEACPAHLGDWYFTGNYPTPGGTRVVNRAFKNYVEGKTGRAY